MRRAAYIGFARCGCPVAAMVAGYESERSERAELKRWIRDGYRIDVMKVGDARALPNFLNCEHDAEDHRPTPVSELDAMVAAARAR